jgi:hypothetical protein
MTRSRILFGALALASLLGCEKKEPPPPPTTAMTAAPPLAANPPPTATPIQPASVDISTLPVEEQYEADAEREITADNLAAKLDEIEKEIDAP